MEIVKFLLCIVAVFALYYQYKALFKLTAEKPEDFNPTKVYWWICAIPFYALYLVIAGEIKDYKTRKQNGY